MWAGLIRQRICNQSNGKTKHATDAQAGDETVNAKVNRSSRQRREPGANGIEQNGYGECSRTANTISNRSKNKAASGPASHEDRCRSSAPLLENVRTGPFWQQRANGRIASDDEQLLVKAIEKPGQ